MGGRGRTGVIRCFRRRRRGGRITTLNRGDVYEAPVPGGSHPAVVVTRDQAIPLLRNVCVVAVTSKVRGLPTEVPLGPREGLARECVANCDNLFTLPKAALDRRRGSLGPQQIEQLNRALRIALDLE